MKERDKPDESRKTEKTITMTEESWDILLAYLASDTQRRKATLETWQRIAKEREEDRTPLPCNAEEIIEYLQRQENAIEELLKKIDSTLPLQGSMDCG